MMICVCAVTAIVAADSSVVTQFRRQTFVNNCKFIKRNGLMTRNRFMLIH